MDFDSDRTHLVNMIRLGLVEVLDFSNWFITVFNPGGGGGGGGRGESSSNYDFLTRWGLIEPRTSHLFCLWI